jgi:PiT family inorganic phosphate transporter
MAILFLSSGLLLGWSLGANDGANVFGTAVGARMVRFRTAALISGVAVVLGAVLAGAGASHTLEALGAVDRIAGSFVVALAAGATVFAMSRAGLPVSTSQAVVGALIGWNVFAQRETDPVILARIVGTWVASPVLAAIVAAIGYVLLKTWIRRRALHLLRADVYLRLGLILAGAFGAYSLGANNVANVVGPFVDAVPLAPVALAPGLTLGGEHQLYLLGGLAIALGIATYSHRVMETVGRSLFRLSPESAFVVVLSSAVVLFVFASQDLADLLAGWGLPRIPLVPVSSTQAVVGGIVGIGLLRGGRGVRFRVLGEIAGSWVLTPIAAGILCYFALFFMQNVFHQPVHG